MLLAATGGLFAAQHMFSLQARHRVRSYGTKMAEAVAPVSLTASPTVAKTGRPRCVSPAFFGLVPPTTFVPTVRDENFVRGLWELRVVQVGAITNHSRWLVERET